jgi:hypothetical protein
VAARRTTYVAPDGVQWDVAVQVPGASNAMILFRFPGGATGRKDRYAWYIWHGPESRSVTGRLAQQKVLDSLDELTLSRLFRRSMPVQAGSTPLG